MQPPRLLMRQVYTDREEAFNDKLVDGTVEGEEADNSEEAEKAARTAKIYAMRAHLEHEFDSVRRGGGGGWGVGPP